MPEFNWTYHKDRSYPHLSRWECTFKGLHLSTRYQLGTTYNEKAEKDITGMYLYQCYISFDNLSSQRMINLGVDSHVLGGDYYRASYDETKQMLEETVLDLIVAIAGPRGLL